jgi:hypothetical protein
VVQPVAFSTKNLLAFQETASIIHHNQREEEGSMESIERLHQFFQTVQTLPKGFVDVFQEEMEEQVDGLLHNVQDFIKDSFSL